MRRIVAVTGGSGFIGKRLIKALIDKGFEVRALENSTPVLKHPQVTPVKGRVTDVASCKTLLEGAQAVVHIAGLVAALNAKIFEKVNVEGTRTLAKVAADKNVKFLFFSSLSARERKLSAYGGSKYKAEKALAEAMPHSWDVFRPTAVYGPGDMQFLEIVKMVQKKRVFLPAHPQARASLIYVDDLVAATLRWLEALKPQQKVYDLHDGAKQGYTWLEVIYAVATPLGVLPKVTYLPKVITWCIAYISLFLQIITRNTSFLPPEKMKQLTHKDWVSKDLSFSKDYNWQAEVNLAKGFNKTVYWYKGKRYI